MAPPVAGAPSCWVLFHNTFADNNDPNVPSPGSAAAGPVGTGMSLSGGRNDTVIDNVFENNGAWGQITIPYLDSGKPCKGGILVRSDRALACLTRAATRCSTTRSPTTGSSAIRATATSRLTNFDRAHRLLQRQRRAGRWRRDHHSGHLEQTYPTCNGQPVPASKQAAG